MGKHKGTLLRGSLVTTETFLAGPLLGKMKVLFCGVPIFRNCAMNNFMFCFVLLN